MRRIALAGCVISILLAMTSTAGCGNMPDPTGNYYYFVGDRPSAESFTPSDGPVATLVFQEGNQWRMSVIMAEDAPIGGTWTREGDVLTLTDDNGKLALRLKMAEDYLSVQPSEGYLMRVEGGRFHKMPQAWEDGMLKSDGQ